MTDIKNMIYGFYATKIDTNILNCEQQILCMNMIFNRLRQQKGNENKRKMKVDLLYRASEQNYRASRFHDLCDEKGPTLTIIHNDNGYIFGGYASKSWEKTGCLTDIAAPDSFLFSVKPYCKVFDLYKNRGLFSNRGSEICSGPTYGPLFGDGFDIGIVDNCNECKSSCQNMSYQGPSVQICGGDEDQDSTHEFKIIEYEVFAISIE